MCMLGPKGLAHIAVPATDTTAIEEDREKRRKRDSAEGMRINPAYHIYEDWVVMCANLNLSVEALPATAPAPAPTACCSHSLYVDMLVNWSLADCIDCSLPVHCLCSHLLPLPPSLSLSLSPSWAFSQQFWQLWWELGLNAGN